MSAHNNFGTCQFQPITKSAYIHHMVARRFAPKTFPPSHFPPSCFASIFNPSRFAPNTISPSRFAPIFVIIYLSYIARWVDGSVGGWTDRQTG